jgi:hypothetical protein
VDAEATAALVRGRLALVAPDGRTSAQRVPFDVFLLLRLMTCLLKPEWENQ